MAATAVTPASAAGLSSAAAAAAGGLALAGAAAASLAAFRRLQGRDSGLVRRRNAAGVRDYWETWEKFREVRGYKRVGYYPGEWNRSEQKGIRPMREPERRLCLAKIYDAMKTFVPFHYPTAPPVKLDYKDVKTAGVCRVEETGEVVTSVEVPEYKKPPLKVHLEQDPGRKRLPLEDAAWVAHMEKERLGLEAMALELAEKEGVSLDKDIIADRDALIILLQFLDKHFVGNLMFDHEDNPIDLVKISKCSKSGALIFECIYEQKNLYAGRKRRGQWKRFELPLQGHYEVAWKRACLGDITTTRMDISGRDCIAGISAGAFDRYFRLVEFDLGGLKLMARVRADAATKGGKDVGLRVKSFKAQGNLTKMRVYLDLLLGGLDKVSLCLHRVGRIQEIHEIPVGAMAENNPAVVEATEVRLGQLVAMLKEVRDAVSSGGDGPWALQLQRDKLLLGKWELPPELEDEGEEAKVALEA